MRGCAATGDTFILKFTPGSVAPKYSTCFGAGSRGNAITADASGDAYVTGMTWDSNFPTTVGALQRTTVTVTNGATSGFVAKLNNVGGLMYATYLSGNDGGTAGMGIALNRAGEIYVAGWTYSTTFPQEPAIVPYPTAGFVAKLTPQLNALDYVTFLGAQINGVAIYQAHPRFLVTPTYPKVYVAGYRLTGGSTVIYEDAFVSMLDENPTISVCCAAIP